jgi:DNA-binding NtrC family response regulator
MGSELRRRLLFIEDNPDDVDLVRRALTHEWQIDAVDRVVDALQYLVERQVDVVLTDLHLPDLSGFAIVEKIRAHHPCLPLVVLTGAFDTTGAAEALRRGAQDYVLKDDMNASELSRTLRYAIERQHLMTDLREKVAELERALGQVEKLSGLLPMCASCKKVRDDTGYWHAVEEYLLTQGTPTTHGLCPPCLEQHHPDAMRRIRERRGSGGR